MISFSNYVSILENTELSNSFYIQKGFPNDIKDFILNYKSNRSPRCHVETAKWYLRLTKEFNAELLVMGAHGHKALKDIILGSTIDAVRHKLNIPILVVR